MSGNSAHIKEYSFQRLITGDMLDSFAALSGDYNPVHMDEDYCREHGLEARIVHGVLVLSLVSALIGMHLPGKGAVWLSQSFDFISPARIGDLLTVSGEITDISSGNMLGRDIYTVKVDVKNQDGNRIVRGSCRITVK